MSLAPDLRRRIEEFVRPLYAGLDGVQTFDRVGRVQARLAAIRGDEPVEEDLLELLVLFHGAVDRLGSLARNSRIDLFLKGLDLPASWPGAVRAGLGRFREAPVTAAEKLLHDAVLLEKVGVRAAAERLMEAGSRRASLQGALEQLDAGAPIERFQTPRGARLGAELRAAAERWIDELRAVCRD